MKDKKIETNELKTFYQDKVKPNSDILYKQKELKRLILNKIKNFVLASILITLGIIFANLSVTNPTLIGTIIATSIGTLTFTSGVFILVTKFIQNWNEIKANKGELERLSNKKIHQITPKYIRTIKNEYEKNNDIYFKMTLNILRTQNNIALEKTINNETITKPKKLELKKIK